MNLFALCQNVEGHDDKYLVKRIPLTSALQIEVEELFTKHRNKFLEKNPTEHEFTGNWKAEDDEVFFISTPSEILSVLDKVKSNIISLDILDLSNIDETPIKALFVYDEQTEQILVHKFTQNQFLKRKFAIFLDNDTFNKIDSEAIMFDTKILCIIDSERILFNSYVNMRMSFEMKSLYVAATNQEIESFFEFNNKIHIDNVENLKNIANQTIRKLLNSISKSPILKTLSVRQIQKQAQGSHLGHLISIKNGKIVLPQDKEKIIATLSFLDEKLYIGALSKLTYITNSTRSIII